jgi:hypothetical protein
MEVRIGCVYKNKKTGKIMRLISASCDEDGKKITRIELEPYPIENNWVGDHTKFDEEFDYPKI